MKGDLSRICTWQTLSLAWCGIDEEILSDEEAGRAYLCGAWQMEASVTLSRKYQLEISSVYLDHAQGLPLLQQFLLDAKVLELQEGL